MSRKRKRFSGCEMHDGSSDVDSDDQITISDTDSDSMEQSQEMNILYATNDEDVAQVSEVLDQEYEEEFFQVSEDVLDQEYEEEIFQVSKEVLDQEYEEEFFQVSEDVLDQEYGEEFFQVSEETIDEAIEEDFDEVSAEYVVNENEEECEEYSNNTLQEEENIDINTGEGSNDAFVQEEISLESNLSEDEDIYSNMENSEQSISDVDFEEDDQFDLENDYEQDAVSERSNSDFLEEHMMDWISIENSDIHHECAECASKQPKKKIKLSIESSGNNVSLGISDRKGGIFITNGRAIKNYSRVPSHIIWDSSKLTKEDSNCMREGNVIPGQYVVKETKAYSTNEIKQIETNVNRHTTVERTSESDRSHIYHRFAGQTNVCNNIDQKSNLAKRIKSLPGAMSRYKLLVKMKRRTKSFSDALLLRQFSSND